MKNSSKSKKKKSSKRKWIEKLDSVFSVFIRLRDTNDEGIGFCISSGKPIYYRIMQDGKVRTNCDCGHFENRRKLSVRFNEVNCNAQSIAENRFNEGNKNNYEKNLILKFGKDKVELVKVLSNQRSNYTEFDLEILYRHYEKLVEQLLNKKKFWNNQRKINTLYK